MKKPLDLNSSMWAFEKSQTLKLSSNLINVFGVWIVVDWTTPFISLVVFPVCQSFHQASRHLLQLKCRVVLFTQVEGCLRVGVLEVFILLIFFHVHQWVSTFVGERSNHQVMDKCELVVFAGRNGWFFEAELSIEVAGSYRHFLNDYDRFP